jgi:hypothetical protein
VTVFWRFNIYCLLIRINSGTKKLISTRKKLQLVDRKRAVTTGIMTVNVALVMFFASVTQITQFNQVEDKDKTSPLGDIGDKI